MIAVKIGTTSWRSTDVLAVGEVEFAGTFLYAPDGVTAYMVWDGGLGNVRAMTGPEIAALPAQKATAAAIAAKASATSGIDAGGTLAGTDLYRLIRAEALALLDAINILRLAIPHPIVSITRTGTTATATTRVAHGRTTGNPVVISGATLAAYNVATTLASAPTATTFTYTVAGNPATPAVGSLSWTEAEVPALAQITAAQVVTSIKAQISATPE